MTRQQEAYDRWRTGNYGDMQPDCDCGECTDCEAAAKRRMRKEARLERQIDELDERMER